MTPAKPRPDRRLAALQAQVLPLAEAQEAFGFQMRLSESQWYRRETLEAYQLGHLKTLVRHAAATVPYYAGRLPTDAIEAATTLAQALALIPILPRNALAADPEAFRAATLPSGQRQTGEERSSGSTGQMVRVATTNLHSGWQNALNFRAALWAGRDFTGDIAVVRMISGETAQAPDGASQPHWDAPTVIPVRSGRSHYLNVAADLDQIRDWLDRVRPHYLMTYPSVLRRLTLHATSRPTKLRLAGVSTVGETVDPELRALVSARLGVEIHDIYSANEVGMIAIQCPQSTRYHVQSEAVIAELLDAQGRPCPAGGNGRVVVTPLFNFASPLLRYEIGDHAVQAGTCSCGRGLPAWTRVLGRTRNMLAMPDGRLYWPSLSNKLWQKVVPVRKYQLRQIASDRLELLLVTDHDVSEQQRQSIADILIAALPCAYHLEIHILPDIPAGAGGKFEQVVNCIA